MSKKKREIRRGGASLTWVVGHDSRALNITSLNIILVIVECSVDNIKDLEHPCTLWMESGVCLEKLQHKDERCMQGEQGRDHLCI
jgi:hypothetical protein